jgi:ADP-ribosylglycohydrolase
MEDGIADHIAGALLGAAVGDALGLPREGLSPRRAKRMFGGTVQHRFLLGRGMTSDDGEHAAMTAQALLEAPDDAVAFARALAWRLRWWLAGLPGGTGKATLLGILRLWCGVSPERSGVFSAGNGPAMRAPILGVCLSRDPQKLITYVRASTRLTHTDPQAEQGAIAAALAASYATERAKDFHVNECLATILTHIEDSALRSRVQQIQEQIHAGASPEKFADHFGLTRGVTGYMYHTVPAALYCFLRQPYDFRGAVEQVIRLGGDTDSTAALVGALAGARGGVKAIPQEWLDRLLLWPRTQAWTMRLADRLATEFFEEAGNSSAGPLPLVWPGLPIRNAVFNATVLVHVLRRLLPPY